VQLRGLYAITPDWPDSRRLIEAVEAALEGGAAMVQLRRKRQPSDMVREEAAALSALCRRYGVPFIVNDDVRLAADCAADGVHLGRDDGSVAAAREVLGAGKLIGVSCYGDVARVRAAEADGADYAAIGSLFPSGTKPAAVGTSLSTLTAARRETRIPLVGIGGINVENASDVKAAGADMIAVIGALFDADSVRDAARIFSALWERQDVQSK
jgi:thiamine-phosphate pyrophosphorylase